MVDPNVPDEEGEGFEDTFLRKPPPGPEVNEQDMQHLPVTVTQSPLNTSQGSDRDSGIPSSALSDYPDVTQKQTRTPEVEEPSTSAP